MKRKKENNICENCGKNKGIKYYPPDNSLTEEEKEMYAITLCKKCKDKLFK